MVLALPSNFIEIEQEEMMYLDGGVLTNSQEARIIGIYVDFPVAIAEAVSLCAWSGAAKIFGVGLKSVIRTTGAGAVVSTLVASLALGSAAAWSIVNFATK